MTRVTYFVHLHLLFEQRTLFVSFNAPLGFASSLFPVCNCVPQSMPNGTRTQTPWLNAFRLFHFGMAFNQFPAISYFQLFGSRFLFALCSTLFSAKMRECLTSTHSRSLWQLFGIIALCLWYSHNAQSNPLRSRVSDTHQSNWFLTSAFKLKTAWKTVPISSFSIESLQLSEANQDLLWIIIIIIRYWYRVIGWCQKREVQRFLRGKVTEVLLPVRRHFQKSVIMW